MPAKRQLVPIAIILGSLFLLPARIARSAPPPASDLGGLVEFLLDFPNSIAHVGEILEGILTMDPGKLPPGDVSGIPPTPDNPLPNPQVIVVRQYPDQADDAIYDLQRTLRRDFRTYTGSYDGAMTQTQFNNLVAAGRWPLKTSPGTYFQDHDRDGDGKLSIGEFTPTTAEIARERNLPEITSAFVTGQPYPTGQMPSTTTTPPPPETAPPPPGGDLYIDGEGIEARLTRFARENGFATSRDGQDRMIVVDDAGRVVPLPPGTIPLEYPTALTMLRNHVESQGGTFATNPTNGMPELKDHLGNPIPVSEWPVEMRPPYLDPSTKPPEP